MNARSDVHTTRATLASWSSQTGAALMSPYDAHRRFDELVKGNLSPVVTQALQCIAMPYQIELQAKVFSVEERLIIRSVPGTITVPFRYTYASSEKYKSLRKGRCFRQKHAYGSENLVISARFLATGRNVYDS